MCINKTENRQIARDSLFVLVGLRVDGEITDHRVKMRNLSAAGMMAEGSVLVRRGMVVWVNLKDTGWVEGTVAWVQEKRFGIAFREEVNPAAARNTSPPPAHIGTYEVRRPTIAGLGRSDGPVRNI